MNTETNNTYYNAKPSNITNLGKDVSGAKRMNFDTYETSEQRETRKRKNATDKRLKEELKQAVLAETPDKNLIAKLIGDRFHADHGFWCEAENARAVIMERRKLVVMGDKDSVKAFNTMINAYNSVKRDLRLTTSDYYFKRYVDKMVKRYAPKSSFIGQSGARFDWKQFQEVSNIDADISYLKDYTSAVQFGNSVSDKERAYIIKELSRFIQAWKLGFTADADIGAVNWSFGARGNGQSVAFYQHNGKVISVNRNNIGSLVHELGHFLDYKAGLISNKISYATIEAYSKTLPTHIQGAEKRYYCSRVEVFARAFEAYCYKMNAKFSNFAQCGKDFLPELNEELIQLVEQVLKA